MKRNLGLASVVGLVVVVVLYFYFSRESTTYIEETIPMNEVADIPEPLYKFGIPLDQYQVLEGKIKRNQTIADILLPFNISNQDIFSIDRLSKDVFSVRNFIPNRDYTLFYTEDSLKRAAYFVYEPSPLEYVVYQLKDSISIYKEEREVEIIETTMSGRITVSLDHSIREKGGSAALVSAVADVFGWQIDMRSLQVGDWFKVIYEERQVNGEPIGIGKVLGAEFNHIRNDYMAYAYDQGDGLDYYDDLGESLQRAFLRYPVEFSRISSRYSKSRLHPVLNTRRAHLGTDFAADKGTPIKAAADGVIIARGYTGGNGNYVKIRHNGTYTTGYLHMSKFGNYKNGQKVKKGDIIGYVGSTGLATGNHLCFRFWKRGEQVDFLREDLPAEKPLSPEHIVKFEAMKELMDKKLNDIPMEWVKDVITASSR
ncbi:M23 family metallopeptidase [Roseivirga sp.]|uniref:M23 family metallopeptidase n=1 Tax=Roseivirga sp. TaxID=1964215 RepID=UPI002B2648D1|nr:peptidoglycan DD-metalloendopeptidase family protein [Roseivirga sp.]